MCDCAPLTALATSAVRAADVLEEVSNGTPAPLLTPRLVFALLLAQDAILNIGNAVVSSSASGHVHTSLSVGAATLARHLGGAASLLEAVASACRALHDAFMQPGAAALDAVDIDAIVNPRLVELTMEDMPVADACFGQMRHAVTAAFRRRNAALAATLTDAAPASSQAAGGSEEATAQTTSLATMLTVAHVLSDLVAVIKTSPHGSTNMGPRMATAAPVAPRSAPTFATFSSVKENKGTGEDVTASHAGLWAGAVPPMQNSVGLSDLSILSLTSVPATSSNGSPVEPSASEAEHGAGSGVVQVPPSVLHGAPSVREHDALQHACGTQMGMLSTESVLHGAHIPVLVRANTDDSTRSGVSTTGSVVSGGLTRQGRLPGGGDVVQEPVKAAEFEGMLPGQFSGWRDRATRVTLLVTRIANELPALEAAHAGGMCTSPAGRLEDTLTAQRMMRHLFLLSVIVTRPRENEWILAAHGLSTVLRLARLASSHATPLFAHWESVHLIASVAVVKLLHHTTETRAWRSNGIFPPSSPHVTAVHVTPHAVASHTTHASRLHTMHGAEVTSGGVPAPSSSSGAWRAGGRHTCAPVHETHTSESEGDGSEGEPRATGSPQSRARRATGEVQRESVRPAACQTDMDTLLHCVSVVLDVALSTRPLPRPRTCSAPIVETPSAPVASATNSGTPALKVHGTLLLGATVALSTVCKSVRSDSDVQFHFLPELMCAMSPHPLDMSALLRVYMPLRDVQILSNGVPVSHVADGRPGSRAIDAASRVTALFTLANCNAVGERVLPLLNMIADLMGQAAYATAATAQAVWCMSESVRIALQTLLTLLEGAELQRRACVRVLKALHDQGDLIAAHESEAVNAQNVKRRVLRDYASRVCHALSPAVDFRAQLVEAGVLAIVLKLFPTAEKTIRRACTRLVRMIIIVPPPGATLLLTSHVLRNLQQSSPQKAATASSPFGAPVDVTLPPRPASSVQQADGKPPRRSWSVLSPCGRNAESVTSPGGSTDEDGGAQEGKPMSPATLRAPSGSDLVRDMSRGFSDAAASTPRRMSVTLATSSAATLSSTLRELASPLAPSTPTPRHSAPQAQPSSPAVPHHADATSSLGAAVPAASADVSAKEQFIQALSMCSDAVAVWEACIEMLLNKRVVHMLVSCFLNLSSLAAVPVCDPSNATFAPCTLPAPPPPTLRATPLPPFLRGTTPGSPMFAQDTITMADAVAVCISLTRSSRASSRARVVQQGAVALISASISLQLHTVTEFRKRKMGALRFSVGTYSYAAAAGMRPGSGDAFDASMPPAAGAILLRPFPPPAAALTRVGSWSDRASAASGWGGHHATDASGAPIGGMDSSSPRIRAGTDVAHALMPNRWYLRSYAEVAAASSDAASGSDTSAALPYMRSLEGLRAPRSAGQMITLHAVGGTGSGSLTPNGRATATGIMSTLMGVNAFASGDETASRGGTASEWTDHGDSASVASRRGEQVSYQHSSGGGGGGGGVEFGYLTTGRVAAAIPGLSILRFLHAPTFHVCHTVTNLASRSRLQSATSADMDAFMDMEGGGARARFDSMHQPQSALMPPVSINRLHFNSAHDATMPAGGHDALPPSLGLDIDEAGHSALSSPTTPRDSVSTLPGTASLASPSPDRRLAGANDTSVTSHVSHDVGFGPSFPSLTAASESTTAAMVPVERDAGDRAVAGAARADQSTAFRAPLSLAQSISAGSEAGGGSEHGSADAPSVHFLNRATLPVGGNAAMQMHIRRKQTLHTVVSALSRLANGLDQPSRRLFVQHGGLHIMMQVLVLQAETGRTPNSAHSGSLLDDEAFMLMLAVHALSAVSQMVQYEDASAFLGMVAQHRGLASALGGILRTLGPGYDNSVWMTSVAAMQTSAAAQRGAMAPHNADTTSAGVGFGASRVNASPLSGAGLCALERMPSVETGVTQDAASSSQEHARTEARLHTLCILDALTEFTAELTRYVQGADGMEDAPAHKLNARVLQNVLALVSPAALSCIALCAATDNAEAARRATRTLVNTCVWQQLRCTRSSLPESLDVVAGAADRAPPPPGVEQHGAGQHAAHAVCLHCRHNCEHIQAALVVAQARVCEVQYGVTSYQPANLPHYSYASSILGPAHGLHASSSGEGEATVASSSTSALDALPLQRATSTGSRVGSMTSSSGAHGAHATTFAPDMDRSTPVPSDLDSVVADAFRRHRSELRHEATCASQRSVSSSFLQPFQPSVVLSPALAALLPPALFGALPLLLTLLPSVNHLVVEEALRGVVAYLQRECDDTQHAVAVYALPLLAAVSCEGSPKARALAARALRLLGLTPSEPGSAEAADTCVSRVLMAWQTQSSVVAQKRALFSQSMARARAWEPRALQKQVRDARCQLSQMDVSVLVLAHVLRASGLPVPPTRALLDAALLSNTNIDVPYDARSYKTLVALIERVPRDSPAYAKCTDLASSLRTMLRRRAAALTHLLVRCLRVEATLASMRDSVRAAAFLANLPAAHPSAGAAPSATLAAFDGSFLPRQQPPPFVQPHATWSQPVSALASGATGDDLLNVTSLSQLPQLIRSGFSQLFAARSRATPPPMFASYRNAMRDLRNQELHAASRARGASMEKHGSTSGRATPSLLQHTGSAFAGDDDAHLDDVDERSSVYSARSGGTYQQFAAVGEVQTVFPDVPVHLALLLKQDASAPDMLAAGADKAWTDSGTAQVRCASTNNLFAWARQYYDQRGVTASSSSPLEAQYDVLHAGPPHLARAAHASPAYGSPRVWAVAAATVDERSHAPPAARTRSSEGHDTTLTWFRSIFSPAPSTVSTKDALPPAADARGGSVSALRSGWSSGPQQVTPSRMSSHGGPPSPRAAPEGAAHTPPATGSRSSATLLHFADSGGSLGSLSGRALVGHADARDARPTVSAAFGAARGADSELMAGTTSARGTDARPPASDARVPSASNSPYGGLPGPGGSSLPGGLPRPLHRNSSDSHTPSLRASHTADALPNLVSVHMQRSSSASLDRVRVYDANDDDVCVVVLDKHDGGGGGAAGGASIAGVNTFFESAVTALKLGARALPLEMSAFADMLHGPSPHSLIAEYAWMWEVLSTAALRAAVAAASRKTVRSPSDVFAAAEAAVKVEVKQVSHLGSPKPAAARQRRKTRGGGSGADGAPRGGGSGGGRKGKPVMPQTSAAHARASAPVSSGSTTRHAAQDESESEQSGEGYASDVQSDDAASARRRGSLADSNSDVDVSAAQEGFRNGHGTGGSWMQWSRQSGSGATDAALSPSATLRPARVPPSGGANEAALTPLHTQPSAITLTSAVEASGVGGPFSLMQVIPKAAYDSTGLDALLQQLWPLPSPGVGTSARAVAGSPLASDAQVIVSQSRGITWRGVLSTLASAHMAASHAHALQRRPEHAPRGEPSAFLGRSVDDGATPSASDVDSARTTVSQDASPLVPGFRAHVPAAGQRWHMGRRADTRSDEEEDDDAFEDEDEDMEDEENLAGGEGDVDGDAGDYAFTQRRGRYANGSVFQARSQSYRAPAIMSAGDVSDEEVLNDGAPCGAWLLDALTASVASLASGSVQGRTQDACTFPLTPDELFVLPSRSYLQEESNARARAHHHTSRRRTGAGHRGRATAGGSNSADTKSNRASALTPPDPALELDACEYDAAHASTSTALDGEFETLFTDLSRAVQRLRFDADVLEPLEWYLAARAAPRAPQAAGVVSSAPAPAQTQVEGHASASVPEPTPAAVLPAGAAEAESSQGARAKALVSWATSAPILIPLAPPGDVWPSPQPVLMPASSTGLLAASLASDRVVRTPTTLIPMHAVMPALHIALSAAASTAAMQPACATAGRMQSARWAPDVAPSWAHELVATYRGLFVATLQSPRLVSSIMRQICSLLVAADVASSVLCAPLLTHTAAAARDDGQAASSHALFSGVTLIGQDPVEARLAARGSGDVTSCSAAQRDQVSTVLSHLLFSVSGVLEAAASDAVQSEEASSIGVGGTAPSALHAAAAEEPGSSGDASSAAASPHVLRTSAGSPHVVEGALHMPFHRFVSASPVVATPIESPPTPLLAALDGARFLLAATTFAFLHRLPPHVQCVQIVRGPVTHLALLAVAAGVQSQWRALRERCPPVLAGSPIARASAVCGTGAQSDAQRTARTAATVRQRVDDAHVPLRAGASQTSRRRGAPDVGRGAAAQHAGAPHHRSAAPSASAGTAPSASHVLNAEREEAPACEASVAYETVPIGHVGVNSLTLRDCGDTLDRAAFKPILHLLLDPLGEHASPLLLLPPLISSAAAHGTQGGGHAAHSVGPPEEGADPAPPHAQSSALLATATTPAYVLPTVVMDSRALVSAHEMGAHASVPFTMAPAWSEAVEVARGVAEVSAQGSSPPRAHAAALSDETDTDVTAAAHAAVPRGVNLMQPFIGLQHLDVSGNALGDDGAADILWALASGAAATSIETLNLADNLIIGGSNVCEALTRRGQGLMYRNSTLRSLSLACNPLDDAMVAAILNTLSRSRSTAVLHDPSAPSAVLSRRLEGMRMVRYAKPRPVQRVARPPSDATSLEETTRASPERKREGTPSAVPSPPSASMEPRLQKSLLSRLANAASSMPVPAFEVNAGILRRISVRTAEDEARGAARGVAAKRVSPGSESKPSDVRSAAAAGAREEGGGDKMRGAAGGGSGGGSGGGGGGGGGMMSRFLKAVTATLAPISSNLTSPSSGALAPSSVLQERDDRGASQGGSAGRDTASLVAVEEDDGDASVRAFVRAPGTSGVEQSSAAASRSSTARTSNPVPPLHVPSGMHAAYRPSVRVPASGSYAGSGSMTRLVCDTTVVTRLSHLSFASCALTSTHALNGALFKCVETNRNLRELDLRNNMLSKDVCARLLVAIMYHGDHMWFIRLAGNHHMGRIFRRRLNRQLRENRENWAKSSELSPPFGIASLTDGLAARCSLAAAKAAAEARQAARAKTAAQADAHAGSMLGELGGTSASTTFLHEHNEHAPPGAGVGAAGATSTLPSPASGTHAAVASGIAGDGGGVMTTAHGGGVPAGAYAGSSEGAALAIHAPLIHSSATSARESPYGVVATGVGAAGSLNPMALAYQARSIAGHGLPSALLPPASMARRPLRAVALFASPLVLQTPTGTFPLTSVDYVQERRLLHAAAESYNVMGTSLARWKASPSAAGGEEGGHAGSQRGGGGGMYDEGGGAGGPGGFTKWPFGRANFECSFMTAEVLRSTLTRGADVLHISCHGGVDWVASEAPGGVAHLLGMSELARLLHAGGGLRLPDGRARVSLVVLAACRSFWAAKLFHHAGVPFVVCVDMKNDVLDRDCIDFFTAFYPCLAQRDSVEYAFSVGVQAVATSVRADTSSGSQFLLIANGVLTAADGSTCSVWDTEPKLDVHSVLHTTATPTLTGALEGSERAATVTTHAASGEHAALAMPSLLPRGDSAGGARLTNLTPPVRVSSASHDVVSTGAEAAPGMGPLSGLAATTDALHVPTPEQGALAEPRPGTGMHTPFSFALPGPSASMALGMLPTPLPAPNDAYAGVVDDGGPTWDSLLRRLPPLPECFLGRNVDMYKIISGVLERRLVTVTGAQSMGKSAVAVAVAHYLALRRNMPDGVVYVDLRAAIFGSFSRSFSTPYGNEGSTPGGAVGAGGGVSATAAAGRFLRRGVSGVGGGGGSVGGGSQIMAVLVAILKALAPEDWQARLEALAGGERDDFSRAISRMSTAGVSTGFDRTASGGVTAASRSGGASAHAHQLSAFSLQAGADALSSPVSLRSGVSAPSTQQRNSARMSADDLLQAVIDRLGSKHILLVLDNADGVDEWSPASGTTVGNEWSPASRAQRAAWLGEDANDVEEVAGGVGGAYMGVHGAVDTLHTFGGEGEQSDDEAADYAPLGAVLMQSAATHAAISTLRRGSSSGLVGGTPGGMHAAGASVTAGGVGSSSVGVVAAASASAPAPAPAQEEGSVPWYLMDPATPMSPVPPKKSVLRRQAMAHAASASRVARQESAPGFLSPHPAAGGQQPATMMFPSAVAGAVGSSSSTVEEWVTGEWLSNLIVTLASSTHNVRILATRRNRLTDGFAQGLVHTLGPLTVEDGAFLFGKLLGRVATDEGGWSMDSAMMVAGAAGSTPGRIVEAAHFMQSHGGQVTSAGTVMVGGAPGVAASPLVPGLVSRQSSTMST